MLASGVLLTSIVHVRDFVTREQTCKAITLMANGDVRVTLLLMITRAMRIRTFACGGDAGLLAPFRR
jgi:hypothetical protein